MNSFNMHAYKLSDWKTVCAIDIVGGKSVPPTFTRPVRFSSNMLFDDEYNPSIPKVLKTNRVMVIEIDLPTQH